MGAQQPDEAHALDRVLSSLNDEWGMKWRSLWEVIERWQRFVEQVEQGYELSLHDYTMELGLRDSLEEVKRSLPARLSGELNQSLTSFDQRLRFVTEPAPKPLAPGVSSEDRWWWFALPRKANVEFFEQFNGNESFN
jgi:hypothetical protein